jgi:hypothetical protein
VNFCNSIVTIIAALMLCLSSPVVLAAPVAVELNEVFRLFALDASYNYESPTWRIGTGTKETSVFDWITPGVKKEGDNLVRYGRAVVSINGYYSTVLNQYEEPYQWKIILNQNANLPLVYHDYIQRVIIHGGRAHPHLCMGPYPFDIKQYLNQFGYSCDILAIGKEKIDYGYRLYQVEVEGKKPFWVLQEWNHGAAGRIGNMTFVVYYKESDAWADFGKDKGESAVALGYSVN